jgi:cobalamin biosynthesis Co2+ chelatase CbiK
LLFYSGDVLKVYDNNEQAVGEVQKYSEDDKKLTKELIKLMTRIGSGLEVFIEPIKNRWRGKQNSRIVIPISVTEKSKATAVWNALNNVCKSTYFKCSKNGFLTK